MTTFEALWRALRAAEVVASAHGKLIDARFVTARDHLRADQLAVHVRDASFRGCALVVFRADELDGLTPDELEVLVTRGVLAALRSQREWPAA